MARFSSALALAVVSLGLTNASCAGDDSSNHQIVPPAVPTGEKLLVDDFERMAPAGVCTKAPVNNCYALGAWYPYDDGTVTAPTIDDAGDLPESGPPANLETIELVPHDALATYDAAAPSKTALRVHGGPYSGVWGSGFSHPINNNDPLDISAYSGVVFWAKRGPGSRDVMHVAINTLDDTAKAQLPDGSAPICKDPATPGGHDGCNDPFGIDLVLHEDWRPYVLHFIDLAQSGSGFRPPGGLDRKNATGIAFGNKQGQAFDVYLDDIALFKE
jgi:hypothetical protein